MEQMIRISIYLVLGFILYWIGLRKFTRYGFRRIYLLSLLCSALCIPFGMLLIEMADVPSFTLPGLLPDAGAVVNPSLSGSEGKQVVLGYKNPRFYLALIYWMGVAVGLIAFSLELQKLWSCFRDSRNHGEYRVMQNSNMAFNLFRTIFIGDQLMDDSDDFKMILAHERSHRDLMHSYDLLFISVYHIIFWFLPIWNFLKKEVKLLHELEVDERVTQKFNSVSYAQLLIKRSVHRCQLPVNGFGQFLTEKRLLAMTNKKKNETRSWISMLTILPLIMIWLGVSCTQEPINSSEALREDRQVKMENEAFEQEVFELVDQMPVVAECLDAKKSSEEVTECSNSKVLRLIYENVVYPKSAQKREKEGTVVCSFIVDRRGFTRDVKLVRSVDVDLDKAALDAMNEIIAKGKIWSPGIKDGKPVHVNYKLPIRFKLQDE